MSACADKLIPVEHLATGEDDIPPCFLNSRLDFDLIGGFGSCEELSIQTNRCRSVGSHLKYADGRGEINQSGECSPMGSPLNINVLVRNTIEIDDFVGIRTMKFSEA